MPTSETVAIALRNAPYQLNAAINNLQLAIVQLEANDTDAWATVSTILTAAQGRLLDLQTQL